MKYRPTFFLKEPKGDRETPINCHVYAQRKRFKIATGHCAHPRQWNDKKQRLKATALYASIINPYLDAIAVDIATLLVELQRTGAPFDPAILRGRLDKLRMPPEPKVASKPVDLLKLYNEYIDSPTFTEATRKNHRKTVNHMKKFAKAYAMHITFGRFDVLFFDKFTRYLLTVQQMSNDSAWNILKCLKAFLNWAVEKGHTGPIEILSKVTKARLLPKSDVSEKVFLNAEELALVRALDLSAEPRLDRVRDLFVFLCFSGIRFGDSQQLRPENVEQGVIRLTLEKNRKNVTVPLLEPAREILARYAGVLPRISNQKANVYLSEVLERAGITAPCQLVTHSGTDRREVIAAKYELCGMHTAKRTFVSLLRQRGVSIEALMKATGNSRSTLERYILRTDSEALDEIRDAWKA